MQIANLDVYFIDFDYIPQMQMQMVAGRNFSREFGTDTTQAMILNETGVKLFGYSSPEDAIGRQFKQWGREGKIIGVVKDFHFRSLQQEIKPLSIRIEPDRWNLVTMTVAKENLMSLASSDNNAFSVWLDLRDGHNKVFGASSADGGKALSRQR